MAQESAATTVQHKQTQYAVTAQVTPSKIAIIGTFDPLKTTLPTEEEIQVFSPEDVGDKAGFGFMAHRLALASFRGANSSLPTFMVFQDEAVAAVAAAGTTTFSGTTTAAGTVHQYIGDIYIPVTIPSGSTAAEVATAVVAAVEAQLDAVGVPVDSAVDGVVPEEIDWTAKTKGPWGNGIVIDYNLGAGQEFPPGLGAVVVDMAGGTGVPDISTALDALGTGDNQNSNGYTELIHGYGIDTATLDAISQYNGEGSEAVGNYAKTVHRPFVGSLKGDTAAGSAGLTAVIALGDGRKALDRTNGIISCPGSPNHPDEIGAYVQSKIALKGNERATASTIDMELPWIIPGAQADRWTDQKTNRDLAVQAGVSPSQYKGGVMVALNLMTFYHPANIPYTSNSYKDMRSIRIIRNQLEALFALLNGPAYNDRTIVEDITKTTETTAIDVNEVRGDLIALAYEMERLAWIYEAAFTVERLKDDNAVLLKVDISGFDITFPTIISGELRNTDTILETDVSIAVLR